VWRMPRH